MLAAIDGRAAADPLRDLHLEGRRGRRAVQDGARRRRRPRRRGLRASTTGSPTSSCRRAFKRFPPTLKVLRYPVYAAGLAVLRPAPLRPRPPQDPGRRRRRSGSSAATTSARRTPPSGATPTCRITGPGVWDLKRAFADFWNLNRAHRLRRSERPLLLETAVDLGAADPGAPQRAAAVDVPDPVDVPRGDQPGQPQHLDDARLLHPRPGLRRRARWPRPGAGSTSACCCRRSPTTSSPTGSRAATSASCSTPGVRIFRFRDAMVHAKTATIDGTLVDGRHRQHRPALA